MLLVYINNKKIPCLSLSILNQQFVVDLKEKNSFFANQCTLIKTGSNLPTKILCRTNKSLNTINFTREDTLSVIKKLVVNKAHVLDLISFLTSKICDEAICETLYLLFSFSVESEIFPTEWKKPNMVLINEMINKMLKFIDLPLFRKIFVRLTTKWLIFKFLQVICKGILELNCFCQ